MTKLNLPKEVKDITSYDLLLDADDEYLNDDFDDTISNYLSDTYGYCVKSFTFNVNFDKNKNFESVDVYNIIWDTTE